jgi:hypothetical protein
MRSRTWDRASVEFAQTIRCGIVFAAMLTASGAGWARPATAQESVAAGTSADIVAVAEVQSGADQSKADSEDENQNGSGLQIEPTKLPTTYLQGPYHVQFHGKGNYVPTLHWSVVQGKLPPGITLHQDGLLNGEAQRTGEFDFVIALTDRSQPPQAVQRGFEIKVVDAITVAWKVPAHVNGNRIEGSVEVSNATLDDVDLTYDVKAIAENGRATEIGYQHFPLTKGTIGMTLPFGDTLPNGAYQVNVSVEGAIVKRNAFYRQQLQTPGPLHVAVGP